MSQTVAKALTLLEVISWSEQPLGLLQLAAVTGLDKSTTGRLLGTLAAHRLVSRSTDKKFSLGAGVFTLSANFMRRHDIRRLAQPHLQRIRDDTRETVSFHLLVEDVRVCLDGIESPEEVRRGVPLGEIQPLHEGPTGKVILAALHHARQAAILDRLALPPKALTDLRRQLGLAATRGYLASSDDRALGISGLSTPVFNSEGVCGSLTVAGPKERWTAARMESYASAFLTEAARISSMLGGGNVPTGWGLNACDRVGDPAMKLQRATEATKTKAQMRRQ